MVVRPDCPTQLLEKIPPTRTVTNKRYKIYMLRCGDGSLYTGIATDVQRRLREHADGNRGSKYVRGRGPVKLVFEYPVANRAAASRIEHRIKRLDRAQKEALIAGDAGLRARVSGCRQLQTSGGAGG